MKRLCETDTEDCVFALVVPFGLSEIEPLNDRIGNDEAIGLSFEIKPRAYPPSRRAKITSLRNDHQRQSVRLHKVQGPRQRGRAILRNPVVFAVLTGEAVEPK
jgi:hypothetical protein